MIELTEREKKLALVKYIIHGVSPFSEAPLSLRVDMLKAACNILGWDYNEPELMEIGQACLDFQESINNSLRGFIKKHSDILIQAHIEMEKGNESFKDMLGSSFIEDAKKILRKGKLE